MVFKVKVKNPATGEVTERRIEADSKEEAYEIARREMFAAINPPGTPSQEQIEDTRAERLRELWFESLERDAATRPPDPPINHTSQPLTPSTPPPAVSQRWRYKMVQIAPAVEIVAGTSNHQAAAQYLEAVVEEYAAEGWEFYRVDQISVITPPGCLFAMFGAKSDAAAYHVVTFRRFA